MIKVIKIYNISIHLFTKFSIYEVVFGYNVQPAYVVCWVFHELGEHDVLLPELFHQLGSG
jgi:hypothetical protein